MNNNILKEKLMGMAEYFGHQGLSEVSDITTAAVEQIKELEDKIDWHSKVASPSYVMEQENKAMKKILNYSKVHELNRLKRDYCDSVKEQTGQQDFWLYQVQKKECELIELGVEVSLTV